MAMHILYKFSFKTSVHFGNGMLGASEQRFCADTLFSAMYIEALQMGRADELYDAVKKGNLRISDAFPYDGHDYYVPKPMLRIAASDTGNSLEKKFYKNLKYIPARELKHYLAGNMDMVDWAGDLASFSSRTSANISDGPETLPYQVGLCSFKEGSGLYIIAFLKSEDERNLIETLLQALASAGIGGKRSAGLGRFNFIMGAPDKTIKEGLEKDGPVRMLVSTALPMEKEMERALAGASYSVIPRSGFVASDQYAPEQRKKRTLHVFEAGSCFLNRFEGDIYDVSDGGRHAVYRYAKPMFLSFDGVQA